MKSEGFSLAIPAGSVVMKLNLVPNKHSRFVNCALKIVRPPQSYLSDKMPAHDVGLFGLFFINIASWRFIVQGPGLLTIDKNMLQSFNETRVLKWSTNNWYNQQSHRSRYIVME